MTEPRWLTPEEIAQLNEYVVSRTREPFHIRDYGLLESACCRPINLYHYEEIEDVWPLAVELLFGIARNHPFEQGNKRTGLEAAMLFMAANGYGLELEDSVVVADLIIAGIRDASAIATFEEVLREYVEPLDE